MSDHTNLPDFDSLPPVKGMPQGCCWGLFDVNGEKDYLGCLNLLTPKIIQEAFKEARDGISISLNWPLEAAKIPIGGRKPLDHKVISLKGGHLDIWAFDDEVAFNTQCSSQWDSLVHYAHQPTGLFYNGIRPSLDTTTQKFSHVDVDKSLPTLGHWHKRGGLVGRGVLLDYRAYAESIGLEYDCFDSHTIDVEALEAVAQHQGTKFKFGDILIVRSGYTEELGRLSAEAQQRAFGGLKAVGVKGCKETARWVWNHHFAAVAGDAWAFEVMPPVVEEDDNRIGSAGDLVLHQYFLSLMGLSIGELWDLKELGEHCKKVGRYEFLLTSVPLNVLHGVGSPPNALAIF